MALVDGNWLNQYVAPGLLEEFKNYKDDFIGVLGSANKAAISADGIRFNKLINNVGFKVNNQDPFTPTKMTGQKGLIEWDKFDTTPTECDDKEVRALQFDKRSEIRLKQFEAFKLGLRDYTLNKLAPNSNAIGTPVIRTTGEDDGTGRLRLTYADLIKFYGIIKTLNLPDLKGLNLHLNSNHQQDLMLDKAATSNYREGIRVNPETGELLKFYSLNLWENNKNPIYGANGVLKGEGEATINTDRDASVFFYSPNTVYHLDSLKILYDSEVRDTRSADPTSEIRIQAYGLVGKKQDHGFGALVSGIKP